MFVFSVLEDIDSGPFMHHLHCSKKVLYIYAVGLICPEFVGLNSYKLAQTILSVVELLHPERSSTE